MDNVTIQKLAAEIGLDLPNYVWGLIAVQSVLTVIAAAIGAFCGEHLRTRGKDLATKADFDSVQQQLKANTQLVETIKAELGQQDWAKREWTNLRRTKLEALLEKVHECEHYLDQHRLNALEGKPRGSQRDPGDDLDTILSLYFPELETEVRAYLNLYRTQIVAGATLVADLLRADGNLAERDRLREAFRNEVVNQEFHRTKARVEAAIYTNARNLLEQIMSVRASHTAVTITASAPR
jgi:hypothetical protein